MPRKKEAAMSAKRIVLTGYEPWAHASKNPTLDILGRAHECKFPNIELVTIPVPAESDKITPLVDGHSTNIARTSGSAWDSIQASQS